MISGIFMKIHQQKSVEGRDNRTKMESLVLSPMSTNQDLIPNLIAISISHRNVILNKSTWNFLVSSSELICLTDPFNSPKER